jgi:hypothetical protein
VEPTLLEDVLDTISALVSETAIAGGFPTNDIEDAR